MCCPPQHGEEGSHPTGSVNKSMCKRGWPGPRGMHAHARLLTHGCGGHGLGHGSLKGQFLHPCWEPRPTPTSSFKKTTVLLFSSALVVSHSGSRLPAEFFRTFPPGPGMLREYLCPHQDKKRRECSPGPAEAGGAAARPTGMFAGESTGEVGPAVLSLLSPSLSQLPGSQRV